MSFFEQMGSGRRVALVVMILAGLAAMWGFGRWATAPVWVPLVTDAEIEQVADITGRLDESGIAYRLERGGTAVSVEEAELARARVALADGGVAFGGRPGFELFDQPSWGMTDFTQRVNYRRALEGELQRTLGRMRGVKEAQVHMALEESSLIRDTQRPAEASIVLTLGRAGVLDDAMVEGVQALVAGSVEGLAPENVTVMDDTGRLLSSAGGVGGVGSSARQFDVRRQVEEYLESKAQALLDRIVGPEDASVRVAAELDFDQVDRTVQEVDPNSRVTLQEDVEEIVPGDASQGASSTTSSSTFETSRSVETLRREGGRIHRLSVAVLLNERPADQGAWASDQLARIQTLVQSSVGFDPQRGDQISVSAVPFDAAAVQSAPEPVPGPGVLDWVHLLQRPVLGLLGALMSLVLVWRLMGQLRTAPSGGGGGRLASVASPQGLPAGLDAGARDEGGAGADATPPARDLPTPRQVEVERPEMTARVVRAWLKEA
jgi:flagellar M-ring protein FliF